MSKPSNTSFASGSQSGIWTSSSATMHSMSGGVVMPAVSNRGTNSNHASYAPPATVGVPQLSVTGSASFQRIHADVANANTLKEEVSAQPMRVGRPGTGSVGELTPIGDGILPLLACTVVYICVRAHRAFVKQSPKR